MEKKYEEATKAKLEELNQVQVELQETMVAVKGADYTRIVVETSMTLVMVGYGLALMRGSDRLVIEHPQQVDEAHEYAFHAILGYSVNLIFAMRGGTAEGEEFTALVKEFDDDVRSITQRAVGRIPRQEG